MADVYIKHNPYKLETVIKINGMDNVMDSRLNHFKHERLQLWIDKLIPMLHHQLNEDEFSLQFHGSTPDFEDVKAVCVEYTKKNKLHIALNHLPAQESNDKVKELAELVEVLQNGPFEELRDRSIKTNFEKAINSEFEICVVATMSSGKSTLINALLGRELMPSRAEACTATIGIITNKEGMDRYMGKCLDFEGNEIVPYQPVDAAVIKDLNNRTDVSKILIDGEIPHISSEHMNLVLVDTPGPNNAMNREHREHTYRVIKNESMPMVLYVLNATALRTDDDKNLLTTVAEQMKVGGKQSRDRFIFAINKADELDTDPSQDGSLSDIINRTRSYLQGIGIENPSIFPISAEVAKLIRMQRGGQPLTPKQNIDLEYKVRMFNGIAGMHFTDYMPVNDSIRRRLHEEIASARNRSDDFTEAMYHSGVPAIESTVREYLDKYAATSKISNAVDSFKRIIEKNQMLNRLQDEMQQNQSQRKEIHETMQRVEKEIRQGKQAEQFIARIGKLKFDGYHDSIRQTRGKIENRLRDIAQKLKAQNVTVSQAEDMIRSLKRELDQLESDIITDLERFLTENLTQSSKALVEEYKGYISGLMDFSAESKAHQIEFFTADLPSATDLISKHAYDKREKVGEKWVANEDKKWYKPWTWFDDEGSYKDVYEMRKYVQIEQVMDEYINPCRENLYLNLEGAVTHLRQEAERLKSLFVGEIRKLEQLLLEKVSMVRDLSASEEALETRMAENMQKREWLDKVVQRLDEILEV